METTFAKDLPQMVEWVNGGKEPDTVNEAYFDHNRLMTLRTRNSAAYKGVYSLLMRDGCRDFLSGVSIDLQTYYNDNIDIHHIFPASYCNSQGIDRNIYNSIINKTPLSSRTNKIIGGNAPSVYLKSLETKHNIDPNDLDKLLTTHLIDIQFMRDNDFNIFFEKRKNALYKKIQKAMN